MGWSRARSSDSGTWGPRSRAAWPTTSSAISTSARRDVAIWKYGAEPTDPTTPGSRVAVDRTIASGGHIRPDAEGLTIVYQPGGTGYLIASSQAASDTLNSYLVYERQGNNTFIRSFKVVTGIVDGCGRTDGIDCPRRRPRSGVPERHLRLPGQRQHAAGEQRQSELQVRAARTGGGSFERAAAEPAAERRHERHLQRVGLHGLRRRVVRPRWNDRLVRVGLRRRRNGHGRHRVAHLHGGGRLHDHPDRDRRRRRHRSGESGSSP